MYQTTFEWTYDNLNRLTDETCYDGTPEDPCTLWYDDTYEYDLAGNRTKRTHTEGSQCMQVDYEFNERDQLVKEAHTSHCVSFYYHDKPVYAYASAQRGQAQNGRITHYRLSDSAKNISPLRAWLMGIPTQWSQYLFRLVALLLPLVFLSPTFRRIILRRGRPLLTSCRGRRAKPLLRQGLILLIAYVMFISPEAFYQLSQADISFSELATTDWASGNRIITYTYDDNGSVTSKTTKKITPQETLEVVTYEYNLQNRLSVLTTTPYENGQPQTQDAVTAEYEYDPYGNRVAKTVDSVTTTYLIDAYNHTGYTQTLEEKTYNGTDTSGMPDSLRTYLIGDDIIAQSTDGNTQYLLYDGHGSTRQLAEYDGSVTIADSYSYDSYGIMLGGGRTTDTNLLYAGEYQDSVSQNYYLRARWYNPSNGRFNRQDPFSGSTVDPQSLHKYNYCAENPVNMLDPSGLDWFFARLGTAIHKEIGKMYKAEHIGDVRLGRGIPGFGGELFPDIMDFALKEIAEIKPLSAYGLSTGPIKLALYLHYANKLNVPGALYKPWTPSTWDVGVRYVPVPGYPNYLVFTLGNASGVIFYKAFEKPKTVLWRSLIAVSITLLLSRLQEIADSIREAYNRGKRVLEGVVAYLDYRSELIFKSVLVQQTVKYGIYAVLTYTMMSVAFNQLQFSYSRF